MFSGKDTEKYGGAKIKWFRLLFESIAASGCQS